MYTLRTTKVSEEKNSKFQTDIFLHYIRRIAQRQRTYKFENAGSRPITEVKQNWTRLVLGLGASNAKENSCQNKNNYNKNQFTFIFHRCPR